MAEPQCPQMSAKAGQQPSDTPGLTSRQEKAIEALLHDPTHARAAVAAGVNERTLRRWTRAPVFRSALLRARREAFSQAIGLPQRYAPVAVATLVKVMNDEGAAASAKVTAAAVFDPPHPRLARLGPSSRVDSRTKGTAHGSDNLPVFST